VSKIIELQEKRATLVTEARAILDRNPDSMPEGDDRGQYDKLVEAIGGLGDRIKVEEQQIETEARLAKVPAPAAAKRESADEPASADAAKSEKRAAFNRYIAVGGERLNERERRALQMDADTAGGFLVAPQEFVNSLIAFVKDNVWMRKLATVMQVTQAESLGIPSLDADPADADWTAEILTGSEDSTMKFGKRELRPHPVAKLIKVSAKLLRASAMDPEGIVIDRLGYKFAVTAEKGYLVGTGNQQPLGVFTATADGISTARDVNTGNTATAIGADNLFEVKFKCKQQYWDRGVWIFHRDALKNLMKLKDTNGQYLWTVTGMLAQRGLGEGILGNGATQPTLVGSPVYLSEYAPNTFTTGKYVGIFGDFSRYWIADSLALQFQRLVELYAATAQVGFIGRLETDGMPALEEAFARVTLA
jgi:HK97 family phage major capsid protein